MVTFFVINKSRLKITIITTATAGIIDFKIGNKSSNSGNNNSNSNNTVHQFISSSVSFC